mgnify:CR=1 FL=1
MATLDVINLEKQKVGTIDLPDEIVNATVDEHLFYEVVKAQLASRRAGTVGVKNRSLVSGGGKKPYKQKGTGRAQAGSTRSPLWRHGGTVFPPQPRSYAYDLPKKVERGALRAALAAKVKEGEIVVVEALSADAIKTKAAAELLREEATS